MIDPTPERPKGRAVQRSLLKTMARTAERRSEPVLRHRFRLIATEDIVGDAPQSGENSWICSDTRGVLAEGDVTRVVRFVLDSPVLSNGVGCYFGGDWPIGQIDRGFERGLPETGIGLADVDVALDLDVAAT